MVSISSRFLVLELLLIKVKSTFKCYTTTINTHIRLTLIEVNWGKGQNNLLVFANNVGSCQMWLACSTAESEVMRQSLRKVQKSVTGQLSSNFSYFQRDRREKLGSAAASPSVFWPCWVSTPCLHSPALTLASTRSNWLSARSLAQKFDSAVSYWSCELSVTVPFHESWLPENYYLHDHNIVKWSLFNVWITSNTLKLK